MIREEGERTSSRRKKKQTPKSITNNKKRLDCIYGYCNFLILGFCDCGNKSEILVCIRQTVKVYLDLVIFCFLKSWKN